MTELTPYEHYAPLLETLAENSGSALARNTWGVKFEAVKDKKGIIADREIQNIRIAVETMPKKSTKKPEPNAVDDVAIVKTVDDVAIVEAVDDVTMVEAVDDVAIVKADYGVAIVEPVDDVAIVKEEVDDVVIVEPVDDVVFVKEEVVSTPDILEFFNTPAPSIEVHNIKQEINYEEENQKWRNNVRRVRAKSEETTRAPKKSKKKDDIETTNLSAFLQGYILNSTVKNFFSFLMSENKVSKSSALRSLETFVGESTIKQLAEIFISNPQRPTNGFISSIRNSIGNIRNPFASKTWNPCTGINRNPITGTNQNAFNHTNVGLNQQNMNSINQIISNPVNRQMYNGTPDIFNTFNAPLQAAGASIRTVANGGFVHQNVAGNSLFQQALSRNEFFPQTLPGNHFFKREPRENQSFQQAPSESQWFRQTQFGNQAEMSGGSVHQMINQTPSSRNYFAQPSSSSFVTQPSSSNFVAQPSSSSFVAQPSRSNFVAQPSSSSFVAQPSRSNFVAQPSVNSFSTRTNDSASTKPVKSKKIKQPPTHADILTNLTNFLRSATPNNNILKPATLVHTASSTTNPSNNFMQPTTSNNIMQPVIQSNGFTNSAKRPISHVEDIAQQENPAKRLDPKRDILDYLKIVDDESGTQLCCELCPKTFKHEKYFVMHFKAIHVDGEKNLRCKICGKRYAKPDQFAEHMERHDGSNRPFSCIQCNKAFITKMDLKRHLYVHSSEKAPHQCPICFHGFTRNDHLERHQKNCKIKGGVKPKNLKPGKKDINVSTLLQLSMRQIS